MSKLIALLSAIVLAGCATTQGWRALRINGSSETSFKESVALFKGQLPPVRRHVFEMAMQDIWTQGVDRASHEQRKYTGNAYFQTLDGLDYDQILSLADPTGVRTKQWYRTARARWSEYVASQRRAEGASAPSAYSPPPVPPQPQGVFGTNDEGNNTISQLPGPFYPLPR